MRYVLFPESALCKYGYTRSAEHHCFKLMTNKLTLDGAKAACEGDVSNDLVWSSRLAEPRLVSEINMLMNMIKGVFSFFFYIRIPLVAQPTKKSLTIIFRDQDFLFKMRSNRFIPNLGAGILCLFRHRGGSCEILTANRIWFTVKRYT